MVSTVGWVVIGIVAYGLIAEVADRLGLLPEWIRTTGPLTNLHTKRGKQFIDAIANKFPRAWSLWGDFGLVTSIAVMLLAGVFVAYQAVVIATQDVQRTISEPKNVLVIPGVNDFLPLDAAPEIVFGLLLALVIHEGGHAIYCRTADIGIDTMGVALLTVIPLGAFVEPNEEDVEKASRRNRVRMYAAGVTNNFAVSVLALVVLFGVFGGAFVPASGVGVDGTYPESPAAEAGIAQGDLIVGVGGEAVAGEGELDDVLRDTDDETVEVSLSSGETVEVERRVFVEAVPAGYDISPGDRIVEVDGESVSTISGLHDAVDGKNEVTVVTESGRREELTVGSRASFVAEGGPLNEAGVEEGATVTIVSFDGERVTDTQALSEALERADAGERVPVTVSRDGTEQTYSVVLGDDGEGNGYLGVALQGGVGGVEFSDFGVRAHPTEELSALLDPNGGAGGVLRFAVLLLMSPLLGRVNPSLTNFPGFSGGTSEFFAVTGPASVLGDGAFLAFNLLFWTFWINVQLGFFNCIPSYPLDGGHIIRAVAGEIGDRTPDVVSEGVIDKAILALSLTMIGSLLVTVFL